jgi:hypothetical protein
MSDLFAFDPQEADTAEEIARANSIDSFDLGPGAFHGVFRGIGTGVMRGGAKAAQAAGMAGAGIAKLSAYDQGYVIDHPDPNVEFDQVPDDLLDEYFRGLDEHTTDAIDYWTPSAQEVGKVGQVLGGLSEIVLPLGAGGPVGLIGTQELSQPAELVRAGVSPGTAVGAGVVSGAAAAAGLKVPVLGGTLATRLATGAGGNVLFGLGARSAEALMLREHPELAPQILDPTAMTTDALTGLLFGALHHTLAPRIDPRLKPSDADAILAGRNAKSFQRDTMPGAPEGIPAQVAHQSALETALEQVSRGEPVDVGETAATHPGSFADADHVLESQRTAQRVAASEPRDVPYAHEDIGARFAADLESDHAGAVERYNGLEDSAGGKILNVDVARELSPDYLEDRTRSAAVHEPASAFIKRLYAEKLAEAPKAGEDPLVVFSAGGTGAGKTSGLAAMGGLAQRAQIIYDTNMNRLESAVQKIEQALAAGKQVRIVYTFRDPIEALTGGALPRAMRQEAKFGSGRTVPLSEHLATHEGSRQTMDELASRYAGDQRVQIAAIDNSLGKGGAELVPLEQIPKASPEAYNRLREEAAQALRAEREAGRISEAVYRGFAADRRAAGPGIRGEPQPTGTGSRLASETSPADVSALPLADALKAQPEKPSDLPELAALEELARANPDAEVYLGADETGAPARISLADAVDQVRQQYEHDLNSAKAYEAAVSCFLGLT